MTKGYTADNLARERTARLWGLVLVRGLVPGALALLLVAVPDLSLHAAAWATAVAVLLESAVDLAAALRLRGVMPRGTLWATGLTGVAVTGLALAAATTTLVLLLIIAGAWLCVRGLAALWVALSMPRATLDYVLPLAVAALSIALGVLLMFWTGLEVGSLRTPAVVYAAGYGGLHVVAAWRVRDAPHHWILRRD